MAQKRTQYVKTTNGLEKQFIASAADIVEINTIEGLDAKNVQDALVKIKDIADNGGVTGVKGSGEASYRKGNVEISPANIGLGNVTNHAQVKRTEMGAANGVATLGADGKVPSGQLPSYVDDVLEYENKASFPSAGETGKIYVSKDTNLTYRWSATAYVEISASLALGETSSTAYAGDKGKALATRLSAVEEKATANASNVSSVGTRVTNIENGTKAAGKATKLATARKISIAGDATGSADFDGSADKTINLTLANSGVAAGTYSAVAVDAKGRVTAGSQIVEWGAKGQTEPSANLAVGGLFFMLIE